MKNFVRKAAMSALACFGLSAPAFAGGPQVLAGLKIDSASAMVSSAAQTGAGLLAPVSGVGGSYAIGGVYTTAGVRLDGNNIQGVGLTASGSLVSNPYVAGAAASGTSVMTASLSQGGHH